MGRKSTELRKLFCNLLVVPVACLVAVTAAPVARATENGGSVYPAGIETILTALQPGTRQTAGYEFTSVYVANEVVDGHGNAIPGEFKLRVFVTAVKLCHNWGWRLLGGEVESEVAVPIIYQRLHVAPGEFSKYTVGNAGLIPVSIAGSRGDLHWYYEADIFTPGGAYNFHDVANVGQHNYGVAPAAAFTWLPKRGDIELSSRIAYIFNGPNQTTKYHSGNELVWELNADKSLVNKHVWLGFNSDFEQQTTDDRQSGHIYQDGNRGRSLQVGGQVRFPMGKQGGISFKYFHDTLVENRARGNAAWIQMSFPLRFGHSG